MAISTTSSFLDTAICPPGVMLPFAGASQPTGWLLCNGNPISRSTFSGLFSALSINFNNVTRNGTTTLTIIGQNPIALGVEVGMPISGTGIPAGATVSSRTTSTIVLSLSATSSGSGGIADICPYGVGDGSSTFNLPNTGGLFLRGVGSQTVGAVTYSSIRGIRQNDTTKVNNLTASASSSSVSVSGNRDQFNISGGDHNHTANVGQLGVFGGNAWVLTDDGNFGDSGNALVSSGGHSHNWSGTFSASGTANAQSITITGGDTETRPGNMSVNYIIKI